jgi:hypothetical protein
MIGSRCRPLDIPVANLNLITSLIRLIDLPRANNKVSTPLRNIREKRSVLLGVDGLPSDAVMQIEEPAFSSHP